jgi:glycosyltransferase involved in cell wall biosynthesis
VNVGFSLLTLFPGRVGGSESNVRGLLEQFAAGNGPSAVTVLANRHVMRAYADMDRGPVSLHEVRSYRPGNSTATRALAMTSARALPALAARDVPEGIDLIHYPVTVPIPSTRAPCVTTVYDLQHHDMPQFFSPVERAYRRWAYDSAARAADMVLTTSAWSKGRLVDLLGLSPERVEVVHMGVDGERFSPQPGEIDQDIRARLGLPERFLIYPANLWPHKNHERLVEALARAHDRELALVLTGRDFGRAERLAAQARRLGVEDRVRHLGYVDRAIVPALYRQAVAMIFPSLYEGFGSPPVEAMACGCPVAASPRGSLAEVCGGAALELDPESVESISAAIDRLSADADLRSRLASAGLERARAFSWRRSAEQHTAIYGHVCATFGAPAR